MLVYLERFFISSLYLLVIIMCYMYKQKIWLTFLLVMYPHKINIKSKDKKVKWAALDSLSFKNSLVIPMRLL